MFVTSEFYFPSSDGRTLIHVNQWTPLGRPVAGVVQIIHGIAEYGGRYAPFARFLCDQGFVVTAADHLGHGLSVAPDGVRMSFGHQDGWQHAVGDIAALQQRLAALYPGLPCFLFGHSMGSFLLRTFLIRCPGRISGAILCGTGHPSPLTLAGGLSVVRREYKQLGADAFSPRVNQLIFGAYNRPFAPARTDYDWLSANPENVDAYLADPLCGGQATLGLVRDMLEGIRFITAQSQVNAMDKNTPVFFISGDQDPVGDMGKGVRRAFRSFEKAGVKDVSIKLYHGLRHEILNEKSSRFVRQDVLDWLRAHS